ncbi:MAG: response regulator [Bacillota bacterium]|nr:response regulator [Bacillota bacterium]
MKNARILVVDDAQFMRNMLGNIIKEAGYTDLYFAGDGIEAVEKVKELKPELVTLDISMPGMDGLESIAKILEASPETKIVMVSAVSSDIAIKQAIKKGASDFILKPFDNNIINDMLKKHIGN